MELPEEDVKDLMCKAGQPVSLETKVGDGEDTVLLDLLAGKGARRTNRNGLYERRFHFFASITRLQCRVLRMRYGMDGDEPMSYRHRKSAWYK